MIILCLKTIQLHHNQFSYYNKLKQIQIYHQACANFFYNLPDSYVNAIQITSKLFEFNKLHFLNNNNI